MSWLEEITDDDGNVLCNACNHDQFKHGPEGGLCKNIECCNCGARWNYGPLGMQAINEQAEKATT